MLYALMMLVFLTIQNPNIIDGDNKPSIAKRDIKTGEEITAIILILTMMRI